MHDIQTSEGFRIRSYLPSDLEMLYQICLKTGDNGNDATGSIDKDLLGHIFAAPYAVFEPQHTHLLILENQVCGYILGTSCTKSFIEFCESNWWPALRHQYSVPNSSDQSTQSKMISIIHDGLRCPTFTDQYPAHLHIDILPIAQGKNLGRKLIDHFCHSLAEEGVNGVHLSVGLSNVRARAFYLKCGFNIIDELETEVIYAKCL